MIKKTLPRPGVPGSDKNKNISTFSGHTRKWRAFISNMFFFLGGKGGKGSGVLSYCSSGTLDHHDMGPIFLVSPTILILYCLQRSFSQRKTLLQMVSIKLIFDKGGKNRGQILNPYKVWFDKLVIWFRTDQMKFRSNQCKVLNLWEGGEMIPLNKWGIKNWWKGERLKLHRKWPVHVERITRWMWFAEKV